MTNYHINRSSIFELMPVIVVIINTVADNDAYFKENIDILIN